MYSPVEKEPNNIVRLGPNKKKPIIKGTRFLKKNEDIVVNISQDK